MHSYKVRSGQETCCERCGQSLEVGDEVYFDDWTGFCSEHCLENERCQNNDRRGGTVQDMIEQLYGD